MARGPRLDFLADVVCALRGCERSCACTVVNVRKTAIRAAMASLVELRYKYCDMETNKKAPEFTLPDENGNPVSLKQFRGQTVVLFFYPRASTPG